MAELAETTVEEVAEPNDAEFTDTVEETTETAPDGKTAEGVKEDKPQSKEDNAKFAAERRRKEQEAVIKQTEEQTIIRTLKGKNPYTNEPIKDSSDVEEYKTMLEIDEAGGDPVADYAKHLKDKSRQELTNQTKEQQRQEWFDKDKVDFETKHPDVDLTELAQDKTFMKFAKGKIGNIAMAEIYSDYNEMVEALGSEKEKAAKAKVKQIIANKNASPGAVASNTTTNDFFTREQVKSMSPEEVKKNLDKINESQKKWK